MSVEDEIGLSDRETVCDMDEAEMKERHEFENIDKALEPLGLFRTAQETAENMESPLDEYSITGDSTGESGTPHEPMDHSDDEINPVDAAQYSLSLSKPQGPKPMPKSVLRRNLTKLLFNWDADTIKPPKPTGVCKFFHFFSPKQVVYRDHEGLLYDCSVNRRAYRELLFAKSEKIKTEKDSVDAMEAGVEEDLPVNLEELNHDFNFTCYCCSFGTPQQSKIKRNYKFKTFGEFKKQMMCQVNKELAKHAGSSSTESMNHRGLIVSFAQNGRSSILCCKVPRDSSESGNRFQAGILLSICLESNNAITLVGTVFDTHPEVEEDGGRNIYDIVSIDGYTTNSVEDWPAVECSIRRLCNINCTKLKMTAIYELSKAVPKHVEFYSPRLKSTNNGIVQVRVSENTKKNFEGNREFYINCLQKAVDTLLVSYQDISRFCVFDDRSDRHLLILAIEIVRQVFLLFEDINNYKRGIWPGDVKKEDPDIEAKKAIAIEPLRLIVTSGKEESLFLISKQLRCVGVRVYQSGDLSPCPKKKDIDKKAVALLRCNLDKQCIVKVENAKDVKKHRSEALEALEKEQTATIPEVIIEIETFRKLARIDLMKEAEVLIGTVDDFLNDEVVQEVAFTGLHKYEGILIHEAGAVDEPSLAALLSCNADKFILVGNSGSKDNYDCSSLFQRLVDSYERQHEQFSSEAKCSVISSYKPVAVKRWRRSDDEKNEVVWFPTATPPPSTAPVADRRQFINGQFVDVPASQQSTENRPSSSGQPNRPRGPLRQPHRRNTPTRGRNWAPPPQRN